MVSAAGSAPSAARLLRCGRRTLDLGQPRVMGIINVTPDSFSDPGRFAARRSPYVDAVALDLEQVWQVARAMLDAGASILDIGGESTRPGAVEVDEDEELRRVVPVVERLAHLDAVISVDTSKPRVAAAAVAAGAGLINDVRALREPGMLGIVADSGAAVCLMHMRGAPATMQDDPRYDDVVAEVCAFLGQRVQQATNAGIAADRILIDPGFGFGKTLTHNLALLRGLAEIAALGPPVMVGMSRKGMLGALTGKPVGDRVAGGLAAALSAVRRGARVVRTHDVAPTVDALAIACAIEDLPDRPEAAR